MLLKEEWPIPDTQRTVKVVEQYKHLGGIVCCYGNLQRQAVARPRSASAAYVPIALKVFGSPAIDVELKRTSIRSLVLSRLLFNVHTVVHTARFVN